MTTVLEERRLFMRKKFLNRFFKEESGLRVMLFRCSGILRGGETSWKPSTGG